MGTSRSTSSDLSVDVIPTTDIHNNNNDSGGGGGGGGDDDEAQHPRNNCLMEELQNEEIALSQKRVFRYCVAETTNNRTNADLLLNTFEEELENDMRTKQKQSSTSSSSAALGVGSHAVGPTTTPATEMEDIQRKSMQPSYMSYLDSGNFEDKSDNAETGNDDESRTAQGSDQLIFQDEVHTDIIGSQQQDTNQNFGGPQPGAFAAGGPGTDLQRLDPPTHQHYNPTNIDDRQLVDRPANTSPVVIFPDNNNNEDDGLVEALPVEETRLPGMMEAEPLDEEAAATTKEVDSKKYKRIVACAIIVPICLVLTLSLAFGLDYKNNNEVADTSIDITSSSSQTGQILIPMENLDILYDNLPKKTKEILYTPGSHQRMAWEWLLNHPDLDSMAEWRKKQIFAMAAFFYSFEGLNWPRHSRKRWMDATTNECSWVLTPEQVTFFTQQSTSYIGSIYSERDYQPCNEDGQLQSLILPLLFLSTDVNPSLPPEIGLLTSLRILGMLSGHVNAKLSDILIPELIELPNLVHINLQGSGVYGDIGSLSREFGLMTALRHLALGANQLTGSIPPQISNMASLEYIVLGGGLGITSSIPTELGLMTRLTGLVIYQSSVTGHVPTELGRLSSIVRLNLFGTHLSGSIPSQLGLLTNMESFYFISNALTGSVPSELGRMTNVRDFELGNDLELQETPLNNFSGSLPNQLWQLSHLEWLVLSNLPNLSGWLPKEMWELSRLKWLMLSNLQNISGSIPKEIMMPNLTIFSLKGSPHISGTIPDPMCFVEKLDFDCSDSICGCDCHCVSG